MAKEEERRTAGNAIFLTSHLENITPYRYVYV
jgi:hypothetical protein